MTKKWDNLTYSKSYTTRAGTAKVTVTIEESGRKQPSDDSQRSTPLTSLPIKRSRPQPPYRPRHWYDEQGNIITLPPHKFFSNLTIDKLKSYCKKYRILDRVEDKRVRDSFLTELTKERRARYEAKEAWETYRARCAEWQRHNDGSAA